MKKATRLLTTIASIFACVVFVGSIRTENAHAAVCPAGLVCSAVPIGRPTGTTTALTSTTNYYPVEPINGSTCPASDILSIAAAHTVINALQLNQTQQTALLNPSNLYLHQVSLPILNTGQSGGLITGLTVDLCLNIGYVSNVPSGINTSGILDGTMNNTLHNHGNLITGYQAASSPYANYSAIYNYSGNPSLANGFPTNTSTITATTATTSTSYTVSVNYDQFTSEAAQYNYNSVYTTTGTKSVNITVFRFPAGSFPTAAAVIAQLSSLGYRPATLSELYAVKTQAGNNIVALGTSLPSYGYPVTGYNVNSANGGNSTTGLSHSAGPFGTSYYGFAAVASN